jgi:hypothetical protein
MRRRRSPDQTVVPQSPWSGGRGASFAGRKALLATLLVSLSLPVHAQGASKVQSYLISVNRLYEDLEYEQALGQIARARRLPRTVEENVALALYEGIILADMSRWEESTAAFKAALSLDPAAKLPVKGVSQGGAAPRICAPGGTQGSGPRETGEQGTRSTACTTGCSAPSDGDSAL